MGRRLHIVLTVVMTGCAESECKLADELRERAGAGATNCGHVALGADPSPVDACVVMAFSTGRAFHAQYDLQGQDSKVIRGVAGNSQGEVTFLLWDSDPSGGSDAGAVVSADSCVGPTVDVPSSSEASAAGPLMCTSTTSLGRTCE
jgi:hypothetical protein